MDVVVSRRAGVGSKTIRSRKSRRGHGGKIEAVYRKAKCSRGHDFRRNPGIAGQTRPSSLLGCRIHPFPRYLKRAPSLSPPPQTIQASRSHPWLAELHPSISPASARVYRRQRLSISCSLAHRSRRSNGKAKSCRKRRPTSPPFGRCLMHPGPPQPKS